MYPTLIEKHRSWLPHGFDLLNVESTGKRIHLENQLRQLFTRYGYKEISPPTFDFATTFQLTTRNAKHNLAFELQAAEGEQLAVRSDLTVQVIKAAANGRLLGDFKSETLRFCYIQSVFQDHPWGSGHKREVLQAGVELLNDEKRNNVEELLSLARECMAIQGLKPRILYGDIRVLKQLFKRVPDRIRSELSLAFHNKDISNIRSICAKAGLENSFTQILTDIPFLFGNKEVIQKLKTLCRAYPELHSIFEAAESIEDVIFDFSLARELSYYTGPVFEAYVPDVNEKLLTGGVYDQLFAEFSNTESCNACGFALNLSLMIDMIEK